MLDEQLTESLTSREIFSQKLKYWHILIFTYISDIFMGLDP